MSTKKPKNAGKPARKADASTAAKKRPTIGARMARAHDQLELAVAAVKSLGLASQSPGPHALSEREILHIAWAVEQTINSVIINSIQPVMYSDSHQDPC